MTGNVINIKNENLGGKHVLITGANGFIGRRLFAALIQAKAKVTVLLRSGHDQGYFVTKGAKVIICKLAPSAKLDAALRGQEVLFNLAYDMRAGGQANMHAFSSILDSAKRGGVKRIIHTSSIVVYDDWPNGQINETAPISTVSGGDYRQTKIAMETKLLGGKIAAAILQPTIVYGPGSPQWTLSPLAALRKGTVALPDPVGICPAVFVDDVVNSAILAANLPDLAQERFIISGPDRSTWEDFFQGYAKMTKSGEVMRVPLSELQALVPTPPLMDANPGIPVAARISATVRRIVGSRRFDRVLARLRNRRSKRGPIYPDQYSLDLYAANPIISSEYAFSRLGYEPKFDLEAGMSEISKSI